MGLNNLEGEGRTCGTMAVLFLAFVVTAGVFVSTLNVAIHRGWNTPISGTLRNGSTVVAPVSGHIVVFGSLAALLLIGLIWYWNRLSSI